MPSRPESPGGNCIHPCACEAKLDAGTGVGQVWQVYWFAVVSNEPDGNVKGANRHRSPGPLTSGVCPDGSRTRLASEIPARGKAGTAVTKSRTQMQSPSTLFTDAGGEPKSLLK